jgi:hypothetical protein
MLLFHAEVGTAVLLEHVELFERAFVQQDFDPLASRQLALGVLGVDAPLAAAQPWPSPGAAPIRPELLSSGSPKCFLTPSTILHSWS